MSDRLDDALRDLARVEAPAGLTARVRARLDQGSPAAPFWPRLAAGSLVLLLAVAGWLVLAPRDQAPRSVRGGGASAPRPDVPGGEASAPRPDVRGGEASASRPAVRGGEASASRPAVRGGEASAPRARGRSAPPPDRPDHERALPALADLAPVGPESLVTDPVVVEAREVAPLAAIRPIDIPALDADEGERR